MRYPLAFCSLLFLGALFAQENNDVLFTYARDIEANRYEDIKGSPYLFDGEQPADLHLTDGDVYRNVVINYNAYSGNWEAKKGDRFVELLETDFLKIEVRTVDDTLLFLRNLHPRFQRRFVQVLFRGRDALLVKDFETTVATVTMQDVGATRETKRFNNKENLILLRRGQDHLLTGNANKTVQALGGEKELLKYVKSEKLKLRGEADLIRLLNYYEAHFVD